MTETRSVRVRVSASLSGLESAFARGSASAKKFADDLERTDQRMSGMVQTGLALGPALVPVLGGASIAAAGAATAVTALAAAGGTVALAFAGVGDAMDAVNKYQLEPTADNLEAMRAKLTELGPAGADFVRYLQSLQPELDGLQSIARQGLFPGLEEGIQQARSQLPLVEQIVANVGTALGQVAEEGGKALSGPFWTEFLNFVRASAGPALTGMAEGLGHVAEGFAGLTMAFGPAAGDLGGKLLELSEAFGEWGKNVGQTQGFQEFIDYLRGVGPEVGQALAAVGNALVQVAQAAAPVGSISLQAIEGLANALAAIANIPVVGPTLIGAAAGIAAISRAVALWKAAGLSSLVTGLRGVDSEGKKASTAMRGVSYAGAGLLALSLGAEAIRQVQVATDDAVPGLNDLTNRLRDLGTSDSGGLGREFDDLGESIRRIADKSTGEKITDAIQTPFEGLFGEAGTLRMAKADVDQLDAAFAQLVTSDGPAEARRQFQALVHEKGLDAATTKQLVSLMPQYKEALEGVGTDADLAAEGLSGAAQAAQQLNKELARLTGALDRRASMRAFQEAIDGVNKAVKENGKTLNQNTQAGRANADVLDNIARTGAAAADQLHGLAKIRVMQQARKEFIDAAVAMGKTRNAAGDLADRLGLVNQRGKIQITLREDGLDKATQGLNRVKEAAARVPKRIDAKVEGNTGDAQRDLAVVANKMKDLDSDTATPKANLRDDASPKINNVKAAMQALGGQDARPSAVLNDQASGNISRVGGLLAALDGRTAQTTVTNTTINRTVNIVEGQGGTPIRIPNAEGNIYAAYANGGDVRNNHQPQIAQGNYRLWAEPETGGESYIPHANDHRRDRAIDIWERTGNILGVQFARFAEGGMSDKERALTQGLRQFKVADDLSGMKSELREFRRTLAEAFGRDSDVLKAFGKLDDRLENNARQAQRLAKTHEDLTDQLHDLRSSRRSLEQSVASNFLSDEAFGGGMADLSLFLRANRNDARAMEQAQRRLGQRGASDAFLRDLAESGNLTLAQELAHASNRELRAIMAQFSQRSAAARDVGQLAGAQVLGDEMRQNSKHLRHNNRAINHNTRQMERLGRRLERRVRSRAGGAHKRARGGK